MARDKQRDSDQPPSERVRVSRRSYLKMSGMAVAATAAVVTHDAVTTVPDNAALSVHGYGGAPVMEQHGSTTLNALSGDSVAALTALEESEPNDTKGSAQPVSVGSSMSATLDPAEVDWFAFDASQGDRVVLTLDRGTAGGIAALILYGPEGDYMDLRYTGSDVPAQVDLDDAPTTATYYAQVVDIQDGSGPYTLDFTSGDETTATPTPTPTPTPTETETDDSFGEQGYGEYGFGGVTA